MKGTDWISWLPIVLTALGMWYVKSINLGVVHYNIFLYLLLGWSLAIILFFRWHHRDRRGAPGPEDQ